MNAVVGDAEGFLAVVLDGGGLIQLDDPISHLIEGYLLDIFARILGGQQSRIDPSDLPILQASLLCIYFAA